MIRSMSLLTTELAYALSMLISAMNITDTVLPHDVAQVSFQSVQRTE